MTNEFVDPRFSILGILRGLAVAENFGDVIDEIKHLIAAMGIPENSVACTNVDCSVVIYDVRGRMTNACPACYQVGERIDGAEE